MNENQPWYREMTRYHWFVLLVAALGWLFDCLDQQLFVLARPAAMKDLLAPFKEMEQYKDPSDFNLLVGQYGGYATSIFLAGWAAGGLFFGVLGDRIGRAKTMLITILMYSLCTGLSALSRGFWDFAFYRFLTGLGVGGEFAVGVALVAEVMPSRARPYTLAILQALSATGNISAAFINMGMGLAVEEGLVDSPWRMMFVIGAVPALLALVIRAKLKEPERWQQTSHEDAVRKQLGSYQALFADPVLRRNALLGLVLACSGVIGLWAIGFFSPDLMKLVSRPAVAQEVYREQLAEAQKEGKTELAAQIQRLMVYEKDPTTTPPEPSQVAEAKEVTEKFIEGRLSRVQSYTSICTNIGAFFGMFGFGALSQRIGRKPTFAIAFLAAFVSTGLVFWYVRELWQVFIFVTIMGFCQLSLFAGYAIYFPELFPTRLRSTGTSFCYNVGRFVAATGPFVQASLMGFFKERVPGSADMPLRYAGVTMCVVFLLGLVVLPFLPETRGKALPE